ncbi:DUF6794 domain-containing protein [Pseudoalteromonas obscura]|uniref:DUF6794 domain-containing protein n=1 Tax=Pseudoalteromonas obscura TaxID=3048491 RepID=A0ABT7EKZ9_9GAMM|nr:DUF6794 domain-containing protein [Pseudoalteromonas sp. P94(2023)]MDK2595735.1 hypothetical protein [Pseudoalteromonas sp. P94(2023)]
MKRVFIQLIIISLILFTSSCATTVFQTTEQTPENLKEAILILQSRLPPEDLAALKNTTEPDLAKYHHGFGAGLRNSLGLWSKSPLAQWFTQRDIRHPDNMSSIIIKSLHRELNGLPWEVDKQLHIYQQSQQEIEILHKKYLLKEQKRYIRRKSAMLGWQWKTHQAPKALLPKQPNNKDVWGLEPYDSGFIVTVKGWRKIPKNIWHDGIYFISAKSTQLSPVSVQGCPEIHDVIVRGNQAQWLCKENTEWSIITTQPKAPSTRQTLHLPTQFDWLRLGKSKTGLIIVSQDAIYTLGSDKLTQLFQAASSTRQYPEFDSDGYGNHQADEFFFPQRSATPLLFNNAVYFQIEDTGNETDLYRLKLTETDIESAKKFFVHKYIGRRAVNISNIAIDNHDNLWIGTPNNGTLVKLSKSGDTKFASIFNNLTPQKTISTEHQIHWQALLPTSAILISDEVMYLASSNGIVTVQNNEITPVVYFDYPLGMNRAPYTAAPQYNYHIKPQRLGKFNDGSFILGDRHDGVYLLMNNGSSFDFYLPEIVNKPYLIGHN